MRFKPDNVLYLIDNSLRLCTRKVYLVDDRNDIKVMVKRKIYIRKRLRLDSLCSVNHKNRSVARRKAS